MGYRKLCLVLHRNQQMEQWFPLVVLLVPMVMVGIPKGWNSVYVLGDSDEVEIVRFIYNQILKKDVSYNSIARELNEKKIPSSHGNQWRDATIKGMLRNPIYAGASYIGKSESGKFNRANNVGGLKYGEAKKQNQTPELIVWDQFESIIKKKDWLKVQSIMAARKTGHKKPKSTGREYPLTGILYCGGCGRSMQGHTNPQLRAGKQVRYRCSCRPAATPECNGAVKEHEILPVILEAVKDKLGELSSPQRIKQVSDTKKKLASIEKKISSVMRKMKMTDDDEMYLTLQDDLKQLRIEKASVTSEDMKMLPMEAAGEMKIADDVKPITIKGLKEMFMTWLDDKPVETTVFRQSLKELGLKVEIFFQDMGADKKYGRWILDLGRCKLDLGVIDNECGRRYKRDTEKKVCPGGGR